MIAWSCVDGNEPIEWAVLMMQEREGGRLLEPCPGLVKGSKIPFTTRVVLRSRRFHHITNGTIENEHRHM